MNFITGNYKKLDKAELLFDVLELDSSFKNFESIGDYYDLLSNIENLVINNNNVTTLKSPTTDNILLAISSTSSDIDVNKLIENITETNISINNYLYPSEFIEDSKEDFWYYPNENLICFKYDFDEIMKIVEIGEK